MHLYRLDAADESCCRSGVSRAAANRHKSQFCCRDLEAAKRAAEMNALMNKNARLEGRRRETFLLYEMFALSQGITCWRVRARVSSDFFGECKAALWNLKKGIPSVSRLVLAA